MIGNALVVADLPTLVKVREDGYSSEFRARDGSARYIAQIRNSTESKSVNGEKMDRHVVSLKRLTATGFHATTGAPIPASETEVYLVIRNPQNADSFFVSYLASWLYAMVDGDGPIPIESIVNFES